MHTLERGDSLCTLVAEEETEKGEEEEEEMCNHIRERGH